MKTKFVKTLAAILLGAVLAGPGQAAAEAGAYLRDGALYVKCAACPDFTAVASGVDDYGAAGESVGFRKGSTLYVVTDMRRGGFTLVVSDVDHQKNGRWHVLEQGKGQEPRVRFCSGAAATGLICLWIRAGMIRTRGYRS